MNRLVIIGNGFDLAHGLPTGYCDFINEYWTKVTNTDYYDDFIEFKVSERIDFDNSSCFKDLVNQLALKLDRTIYNNNGGLYYEINLDNYGGTNMSDKYVLTFKNTLFGTICNKHHIQNWVDVENEYYQLLKNRLKDGDSSKIKKLNEEFEEVKKHLENYLCEIQNSYNFQKLNNSNKFSDIFKNNTRFLDAAPDDNYLKEFPQSDHEDLTSFDNQFLQAIKHSKSLRIIDEITNLQRNLFLSFNYTPTIEAHIKNFTNTNTDFYGENKVIHIHGKLNNKENPINFGFGDEMDDHYKQIENKDDNEYLRNIKSFQYLQNSNYKDLLDFIDSEKFQVYIMGHSCGLSDRILLNTIFEHEHCRSIKVFYHEKDGKDNYTDIVQNISRHFNKKKMMRDKLVNKSLCQPLPQNIRFALKK